MIDRRPLKLERSSDTWTVGFVRAEARVFRGAVTLLMLVDLHVQLERRHLKSSCREICATSKTATETAIRTPAVRGRLPASALRAPPYPQGIVASSTASSSASVRR
jgi:hypothetical protein